MPTDASISTAEGFARRRTPCLALLLSALVGILLDRFLPCPPWIWGLVSWSTLLLWFYLRTQTWGVGFLCFAMVSCLASRHALTVRYVARDAIESYASAKPWSPVHIRGEIGSVERIPSSDSHSESLPKPAATRLCLETWVRGVRTGEHWNRTAGQIRVWVPAEIDAEPGALIDVYGYLRRPNVAHNPGEMDLASQLRGMGATVSLHVPSAACVQIVQEPHCFNVHVWIARLRDYGQRQLLRYVHPAQQGLATAILLGFIYGIPPETNRSFMLTGIAHVLSISGFHVAMMVSLGFFCVRVHWLPHHFLRWLVVGCGVYAGLTGARAPVIRACVLAQLVCWGWLQRRPGHPWNALAASATLLLFVRPAELFQIGSQLSFLAVAALGWSSDLSARQPRQLDPLRIMERAFQSPTQRWRNHVIEQTVKGLQTSLAVWCVTTPLIAFHFGILSPWAVLLNLLLTLPVFLALMSGIVVMTCGTLLPPLAWCGGFLCSRSLALLTAIGAWAEQLPLSYLWVLGPARGWLLVFYLLWVVLSISRIRLAGRTWLTLWCLWMSFSAAGNAWHMRQQAKSLDWRCHFLSVGHGTCVLLELPGRFNCLYDAGKMGATGRDIRTLANAFRTLSVDRIHIAFLSHADTDHFNLLAGLGQAIRVDRIFTNPHFFHHSSPAIEQLSRYIDSRRIHVQELQKGERITLGPCSIDVLHPPANAPGSDNARSLVLQFHCLGRTILLPGDLESPGLAYCLATPPRRVDVAMAPHHGRGHDDVSQFHDWCHPQYYVISGNRSAPSETIERSLRSCATHLFHTDRDGCITITFTKQGIMAKGARWPVGGTGISRPAWRDQFQSLLRSLRLPQSPVQSEYGRG